MKLLLTLRSPFARFGNLAIMALGFVLLTSLLLIAFASPTQAASEPTSSDALASISGKVTDENGQPMVGITVTVYRFIDLYTFWQPIRLMTTTVAGEYKAIALRGGIYRLQFNGTDVGHEAVYWGGVATVTGAKDVVVAGESVTGIDITLHPGSVLAGSVSILNEQRATSGDVYAMQQVGTEWVQAATSSISTTGTYEISGLPAGVYRLWASGYLDPSKYIDYLSGVYQGSTLENAQNITLTTSETKTNLDIALGFGQNDGVVMGKVTAGDAPLAGIRVNLYSAGSAPSNYPLWNAIIYTYTDESGLFKLGGLSSGDYYVGFVDPTDVYATEFYSDKRYPELDEVVRLDEKRLVVEVNASLIQAGIISGTLRYATGAPATNTYISLMQETEIGWQVVIPYQASTDNQGNYQLKSLWPGSYRLSFNSPLFSSEYYGTNDYNLDAATIITVEAGSRISNINQIIGSDFLTYLPVITK